MAASNFIWDAAIQFKLGCKFESVSNSLGGARPSFNQMAESNTNSDAAI
jgi:hypothetical protein